MKKVLGVADIGRVFLQTLLWLYVFFTLILPASIINKVLFVFLFFLIFLILLKEKKFQFRFGFSVSAIFFIFVYGFFISLLNNVDENLRLQLLLAPVVLILINLFEYCKINPENIAKFGALSIVAVTLLYAIASNSSEYFYVREAIEWYEAASLSTTTVRDYLNNVAVPIYALSTVSFLFVPFSLFVSKLLNRFSWMYFLCMSLILITIFASGRRGLILISIFYICFVTFIRLKLHFKLIFLFLMFLTLLFTTHEVYTNTSLLSVNETSNSIKLGHISSFFSHITAPVVLFGEGLGSYYNSSGTGAITSQTEITFLDSVRYVGLPLSVFLFFVIMFPAPYTSTKLDIQAALVLYVLLSFTNPVLFNSFGMLSISIYWMLLMGEKNSKIGVAS